MQNKIPTKKIPIETTKVAVYWRIAMYVLSAAMFARVMADFTSGFYSEGIGNLGLSLMFGGLYFRSREVGVLAYLSNPEQRERALRDLQRAEKKYKPWVGYMVKCGWLLLIIGLVQEMATIFHFM